MYKRKLLITTILTTILCLAFSCKNQPNSFEIKGKLSNVEGDCFYIILNTGSNPVIDTININSKGEFSYVGQTDTLSVLSMFFNNNKKHTYILVDKGWKIEVKGDVLFPDLIEVKGGNVNNDLTAFKQQNKDLLKARDRIISVEQDSVSVKESRDENVTELKNMNFELSNIAADYIKANPTKIASVVLIDRFFKNDLSLDRLDENLNLLRGEAEHFPITEDMRNYSKHVKLSIVGAYAPSFTLKDNKTNKDINLSDFRGKYVLLSFVSTTCEACDAERKDAIKVYNTIKQEEKKSEQKNSPKTVFITIVINTEKKPIPKGVTDSIKWIVLQDKNSWAAKTFNQYNIHEIPYHILISPQGNILERDIPLYTIPDKIKELQKKD